MVHPDEESGSQPSPFQISSERNMQWSVTICSEYIICTFHPGPFWRVSPVILTFFALHIWIGRPLARPGMVFAFSHSSTLSPREWIYSFSRSRSAAIMRSARSRPPPDMVPFPRIKTSSLVHPARWSITPRFKRL